MPIKNIVFDVGNVLFRWDPVSVVLQTFPEVSDPAELSKSIFKHPTWFDLNLGHIDEQQAIELYKARLIEHAELFDVMMDNVRASLVPLEQSISLLKHLSHHYTLYALTDNTLGIMAYLKQQYDIWSLFKGIVVSAEVGHLKPSEAIYRHLLDTYAITPSETIFIDDMLVNVEGARKIGIKGIQFNTIEQCRNDLQQFGVELTKI